MRTAWRLPGILGLDVAWCGRTLAGVAVAQRTDAGGFADAVSERVVSVWGLFSYGVGTLSLSADVTYARLVPRTTTVT